MHMHGNMNNPKDIAERGREIYNLKYRGDYEREHLDRFVAINVRDESATLGNTASEALLLAKETTPSGLFHLIRVGHAGAYEFGLAYGNVVPADRLHR